MQTKDVDLKIVAETDFNLSCDNNASLRMPFFDVV